MKPLPNFFLTNRSLLEHPELTKDRSRQLAWVYIIGRCNFETGRVNLTEVYRELVDMFTYSKWRSFLDFLKKNEMLEDFQTENMGDRAGYVMTASVKNWFKYQGENSKNNDRANSRANTERTQSEQQSATSIDTDETRDEQQSEHRANVSTTTERTAVSNKEYKQYKEVKEITPPTPPSEDEKLRSASMQLIGREEIVRDTQRLKFESPNFYPKFMDLLNYGGAANYRIKEAKAKQCLVLLESYGESNLIKAADTAILQCGEASRIFGYFAKILQSETPITQQTQKDVAAARPAINRAEVYERYFDEALDNGMDDANAEVYAARKLQEALNGHSMVS